jgi:hypothetical protein
MSRSEHPICCWLQQVQEAGVQAAERVWQVAPVDSFSWAWPQVEVVTPPEILLSRLETKEGQQTDVWNRLEQPEQSSFQAADEAPPPRCFPVGGFVVTPVRAPMEKLDNTPEFSAPKGKKASHRLSEGRQPLGR